jgi:hypothetical protein
MPAGEPPDPRFWGPMGPTSVYSGSGPNYQASIRIGDIELHASSNYSDDVTEQLRKMLLLLQPVIAAKLNLSPAEIMRLQRFWNNEGRGAAI